MFDSYLYILGRMHGLTVEEIKQAKAQNWDGWSTLLMGLEAWAVVEAGLREFARHKWETAPPREPEVYYSTQGEIPPDGVPSTEPTTV